MVFEGFMDFLSYQMLYQNQKTQSISFLVLNSLSFLERAIGIMDNYSQGQLYLDHDDAGRKATANLNDSHPRFRDCSYFYENYKDLNEMLMTIGMSAKVQHQVCREL